MLVRVGERVTSPAIWPIVAAHGRQVGGERIGRESLGVCFRVVGQPAVRKCGIMGYVIRVRSETKLR